MNTDTNKINVSLYGGKGLFGGRESPLEADEIYCDMAADCSFHKQGKCLRCRAFLAPTCIFGRSQTIKGYTSRAAKYYDFKKKYTQDELYSKLDYPNTMVAVMGETIYLRTIYVDVRKRREKDEAWKKDINGYIIGDPGFGNCHVFMPIEDATNELLYAMFNFKPRSMMGGTITDWPDEKVPALLQDMKSILPEMYQRFVAEFPEYQFEPNYIGKKAYVDSLRPGTIFVVKNNKWLFDGECVESVGEFDIGLGSPWWLTGGTKASVKIRVNPKMTFEINDNSIVDESTRFE